MTTKVNYKNIDREEKDYGELLSSADGRKSLINDGKTAFIGRHEDYPRHDHKLFLVNYNCIVLADDPSFTWDTACHWKVDRWIDIEINALP